MEDERKNKGAGAAGGTLKDEAASGGEGQVSFGSLMMGDFEGADKGKEPSGMEEALSTNFILSGSHGRNEVSEILKRREGDDMVLVSDDGPARTGYQQRIIEAARDARERYLRAREEGNEPDFIKYGVMLAKLGDALVKDGLEEDPEIRDLTRAGEDEPSVIMDAGVAKEKMKRMGIDATSGGTPPEPEVERDIGSEIDDELSEGRVAPEGIGAEKENEAGEGLDFSAPAVEAPEQEVAADEVIEEKNYGETGVEREVPRPPALPERVETDEEDIDSRTTDVPPAPRRIGLPKMKAGTLELTPLGDEEGERIAKIDTLSMGELKEMAAERRKQAGIAFNREKGGRAELGKWYPEFMLMLQNSNLDTEESLSLMRVAKMELLKQADELEILAAGRIAVPVEVRGEPVQPKRPSAAPRKGGVAPKPADPEVDSWAEGVVERENKFFDKGDSGAFGRFLGPDGKIDVGRLYGDGTASLSNRGIKARRKKAGEVHVVGDASKRRAETALGIPAANLEAAVSTAVSGEKRQAENLGRTQAIPSGAGSGGERMAGLGVAGKAGGKKKIDLSRTGLFGQFDNDPEIAQIAEEGSGALSLEHIQELSGAKPLPPLGAGSGRIPTGQLPAVSTAVKEIAGLGDTNIRKSGVPKNEGAPEAPPYGVDAEAGAEIAEGSAPVDPARTAVVQHKDLAANGGPKVWGEAAFDQTRLSSVEAIEDRKPGVKTRNERPKEDFSVYGDVFYAVEKVYMESTGIPEGFSMNSLGALLPDAIGKAEMLSNAAKAGELRKGETQLITVEEQRVSRLKKFRTDFFEIPEGKDEPKKSFLAYGQWLTNKRGEYGEISDVHELLGKALAGDLRVENKYGVSPGEYNRVGMLRLCNAAIKKGTLSEQEEAKVEKLREMLEPVARGETDIYAQTIAADATYEMMVGFATKGERAEMRQLRKDLAEYRITVAEFEAKRENMIKVLVYALQASSGAEKDSASAKDKIKEALVELEPDALKRQNLVKFVMAAQSGAVESGKPLMKEARSRVETVDIPAGGIGGSAEAGRGIRVKAPPQEAPLSNSEVAKRLLASTPGSGARGAKPAQVPETQRQSGPVARSIGTAITMAAGAALLAGGLWLNQSGIITLGTRADAEAEKPVVAQVEEVSQETLKQIGERIRAESPEELPAGVVAADAGKGSAKADAGVDDPLKAIKALPPLGADGPEAAPEKYARDKAGLKMALDDWCQKEEGLLVSGEMLRASYASIEGKLDGNVLPQDAEWVPLMLGMKFPNRMIELSIMSDIARGSSESEDAETLAGLLAEKYAAYTRLSILLGKRAGNPKGFETTVAEANRKGIALPPLDKESHVGKIEGLKVGERCLFSAYHETVMVTMAQIMKEVVESGTGRADFLGRVHAVLGENAERIEALAKDANFEANFEERRGYCGALTGGKRGAAALDRAGIVTKRWERGHKKAKAQDARYQKSVDEVLGSAPKVKTNAPKPKAKKAKQPEPAASSCAGIANNLDFMNCQLGGRLFKQQPGQDSGEKTMPKPKGKESGGSVSKAPRMFVRY